MFTGRRTSGKSLLNIMFELIQSFGVLFGAITASTLLDTLSRSRDKSLVL
jgi:hypothetical protein